MNTAKEPETTDFIPASALLAAVEKIAQEAGKDILLPAFISQSAAESMKEDGSIVTETDQLCQDFLQERLTALASDIGFLGEEMAEQDQLACLIQGEQSRFWCVDPLDGTGNFANPMPLFAISIALIEHGQPVLACIYDPVRDEMFSAVAGQGFYFNGQKKTQAEVGKPLANCIGFVDFKRLTPALASHVATQPIYRSQRNIGTCALEWAWLAVGRAQFIVHGGQKLWDYAAGALLAEESGCVVSDFEGKHPFATAKMSCSILAAARQEQHQAWQKHIQAAC
ncbi:MAG: inositol monophosphatase family protein [Mariprofundaceae bacterium]|nr:inositol monophosphatase family protein [Mariprofundaceae bacterium]